MNIREPSDSVVLTMYKAGAIRTKLRDCLRWATIRSANPKRGWPQPDLTLDDLCSLWNKQRALCALTGVPLELSGPNGATLDRRDPRGHYARGNVIIVTKRANQAKGDMTMDEFRQLCRQVLELNRT
jgi:hypothetical protein